MKDDSVADEGGFKHLPSTPEISSEDSSQGQDLSGAETLPPEQSASANILLQQWNHSKSQQLTVVASVLVFAALLFISAIIAGLAISSNLFFGRVIYWHFVFLVVALVVPPTVIVVATLKAVHPESRHNEAGEIPGIAFIKELCSHLKDTLSK